MPRRVRLGRGAAFAGDRSARAALSPSIVREAIVQWSKRRRGARRKAVLARRYHATIACLEPLTTAIFLAHRIDGAAYDVIAERHGVLADEVTRHIATALCVLDRELIRMEEGKTSRRR
jgi:DNA-directed RNA polymerase specialized sigma24 family protein